MEVAVVVPVYNRHATVPLSLTSVGQQTVLPARLIVVDDGSTDGTAAAVEHWRKQSRPPFEVQIVRQSNQGAGAARNVGLTAAGNLPLVAFLDSDDLWPRDFLRRTVIELTHRPDAVTVSTDLVVLNEDGVQEQAHDASPVAADATWWFFGKGTALTSCTVLRTDIVRRLGGFHTNLLSAQDIELFLRISLEGSWLHAPGAPVEYRTARVGDEPHLSQIYPECTVEWAQLRTDFAASHFDDIGHAGFHYRRALARFWYEAGRAILRQGRIPQARECFWRAIQLRPLKRRAWWNLAESFVR